MNDPATLRRTSLYAAHEALGARIVPFAGWQMPVQYEGIVKEHEAVRQRVGLFDVSHMGELEIEGPEAVAFVDGLVTNAIAPLPVGKAAYTVCCNERGTILDDLIVYRRGADRLLVVCNASNRDKIAAHFAKHAEGRDLTFRDASDDTALIAIQGPKAVATVSDAGAPHLGELPSFGLGEATIGGVGVLAARTGYTGEDGFELFCAWNDAPAVWAALMKAGEAHGIAAAGLGARDTLRLEGKLSLYGNDIDETTNPLEAGLGWVVKLDHGDFIGRDALIAIRDAGTPRKLVGLVVTGRGIARHGYPIVATEGTPGHVAGERIGEVTSGSPSPTTGKNIGLGYVPAELAKPGTPIGVEVRGKIITAEVAKTPFYRRPR
ncbi:MAG: glycine cleavage system aminomethyltransferase GcvT [Myxococcales bacterium]|nr:glycine cleavage system aminomethyltransferase GcvT [Myxococcales bacterium]